MAPDAGYSGTPLPKKLGLQPGQKRLFLAAPAGYALHLGLADEGQDDGSTALDFIQIFATRAVALAAELERVVPRLATAGALWISWPKKSARVATDLGDAEVRRLGLATGLVDIKVCAVDDVWSGLKFVRRRTDRPPKTP